MKIVVLLLPLMICVSCASNSSGVKGSSANTKAGKPVDIDKINCTWNKTIPEAERLCQKDPNKKSIASKLDTQLSKDAKKIKKFFGIKSNNEEKTKATK